MQSQRIAVALLNLLVYQVYCFNDVAWEPRGDLLESLCKTVTVNTGQARVILPCIFRNITGTLGRIRWGYGPDDKEVLTIHSSDMLDEGGDYKGRIEIPNTIIIGTTRNISLILKRPLENDTGRYRCSVTTAEEHQEYVNLAVGDPVEEPNKDQLEGPCETVMVNTEQDHVVLPCIFRNISGKRGPIRWELVNEMNDAQVLTIHSSGVRDEGENYKGRVEIPNTTINGSTRNISLILKRPRENDTGRYKCSVTTREELRRYIHLKVQDPVEEPNKDQLEGPFDTVMVNTGQDEVVLPCIFRNISGKLGPIRWEVVNEMNDAQVLTIHSSGVRDEGEDYKGRVAIPNTTINGSTRNISLILKRPRETDAGRYKCSVTTREQLRRYIHLQVQGTSMTAPQIEHRTINMGLTVGVPCAVGFLIVVAVIGCFVYRRRTHTGNNTRPGTDDLETQVAPLTAPVD